MSGNAGIRGYIVQTIISVLDALSDDATWSSVTLEPTDESEKVDIRWRYPDGTMKAVQVKSSQNTISKRAVTKWCRELKSSATSATTFEFVGIGIPEAKLTGTTEIQGVNIKPFKNLDMPGLIDQASTKIDKYYERNGKPKISASVREILVKNLTLDLGIASIFGKEISRAEFDKELMSWIASIEKQIETNPFIVLAAPTVQDNRPLSQRIIKKVLELIGWKNFNENESIEVYNEHTEKLEKFEIDFSGEQTDKLKEETTDLIQIKSIYDLTYPNSTKSEIKSYLNTAEKFHHNIKSKNLGRSSGKAQDFNSILFWLSSDNKETNREFVNQVKPNYKDSLFDSELTYFFVDNSKINFLVSAIITAHNYRPDVINKFLYPITEANYKPGDIGQRGTSLPTQYINSSVLPIIKENKQKISILLFCNEPFSVEAMEKLLWLIIKLTSGFSNEYLLYFQTYDQTTDSNKALETIRKFTNAELDLDIKVDGYKRIDASVLESINIQRVQPLMNEEFEGNSKDITNLKQLTNAFTTILPYGDILKPFLKTDAISANDIKIFLAKKGIYIKGADKNRLIEIMSSLLLSPGELEDFKALIDIKVRPLNTAQKFLKIDQDDSLDNVFKKVKPNFDNVTDALTTKLIDPVVFVKNPENPQEFLFSSKTEREDPTSQISVNKSWGKIEVAYRKDGQNLVINTVSAISKDDRTIANRIANQVQEEFRRVNFVKDDVIDVMFKNFKSNTDRVNFLLSFTNVTSSSILKEPDIKQIKYSFDENQEIPDGLKDKKDKELIMILNGKNLKGLSEIANDEFKKILLLEEIDVSYKFESLNVSGVYNVTYNFSSALKNKPEYDGVFKSAPSLMRSSSVKKLQNIDTLSRNLSKEIERLKMEKFKQFGIIA